MRRKFILLLQTPFDPSIEYDEELKEKAANIALTIEENINSKYIADQKGYAEKVRSLVFNLKDVKNPKLRDRIINGDLTPWDIVTAGPKELASEEKKEESKKHLKENLDARRTDWQREQAQKSGKNIGFFTCKKCQSKNTTYYQMQTRGADEPMTNFVQCLNCGN